MNNPFHLFVWAVGRDCLSLLVCIMAIQLCLTFALLLKQISYHGSEEGGESEDSEGENQELAQIDRGVYFDLFIFIWHMQMPIA